MFVSQLYQGVATGDVATVLAAWMCATPQPLTCMLEDLTGTPASIRVLASGERPLTSREQFRLGAGPAACRWRHSLLIAGGQVAASASLLWLPARLPAGACRELDAGEKPAGAVLRPYGMKRTDRRAMATTGMIEEVTGQDAAVMSSAVLTVRKVAAGIAEETITRAFAAALAGGAL